jgi:hypothetical protein
MVLLLLRCRSDNADMAQRKKNRSLELVWRGSEAYGSESDLFTHQYPTGNYGAWLHS